MAARGHALTIVCRNQARADHTLRASQVPRKS